MEHGSSMPHLQGLSNNPYPESNQPNSPHWYSEGRSNFSTHLIEEGHEMKNIDNILTILHKENNHKIDWKR